MMKIITDFDSGSIEVIEANELTNIRLKLLSDNKSCTKQWFHFRLESNANQAHQIHITDAGKSTFAKGWENYQVLASYDQQDWFRVTTKYDAGELIIQHTPEQDSISYAYFIPYDYSRHQKLIETSAHSVRCQHKVLGETIDGNPIDLLIIGEMDVGKKNVWIIARQHPGETMAEWFAEGLINRLLGHDNVTTELLDNSVFYVVPNMNPDGSIRGNHTTNALGKNLNREWDTPSHSEIPEVFYVMNTMNEIGVDLFFDIHGDEEVPYSFMMGNNSSEKLKEQALFFKNSFVEANSKFQVTHDYDSIELAGGSSCCGSRCGRSKYLTKATDYVENKFGCLSLFLEMPFKKSPEMNDEQNPNQTCLQLGASFLEPILKLIKI